LLERKRDSLSVLGDPGNVFQNVGIHSGVVRAGTSDTPGDNSDLGAGFFGSEDHGATRVSLARVLSSCGSSSADHALGDWVGRSVLGLAFVVADDLNGDTEKGLGDGSTFGSGTPASDDDIRAGSRVGGGETDGFGTAGCADGQGVAQLQDADIVVQGRAAVVGVTDDLADSRFLVSGFRVVQGVETSTDGAGGGGDGFATVSSGQNGPGVEDGTTANVASGSSHRDLMRGLANSDGFTTNNSRGPHQHGPGEGL